MGIYSGNEIYGIRCHHIDDDNDQKKYIFELQFRSFGEVEKAKVKELMKTEELKESTHYVFQLYRSYSTSHNFCANWDEARCFMWVNTELSVIEKLLC
jgi:hypothetical protein